MSLQGFNSTTTANVDIATPNLVETAPFPTATFSVTAATVANNKVSFLNPDGTVPAVTTTDINTYWTATGNTLVNVDGTVANGLTALQFSAATGTDATPIKVGMIMRILGDAVGGATPADDIYLRINENWMAGTSIIKLTDDSKVTTTTQFCDAGRIFQIISGSAGVKTPNTSNNINGYTADSGSYGFMLPDISTLILNGEALDAVVQDGGINFGTSRSFDTKGDNSLRLVEALDRAGSITPFTINSQEDLSSDFIFCRAKNSEYNYSANPSFISSSTGAVLFPEFTNNPTTYITTVGMYNPSGELLAVAKLSRPLEKNFTKELLVRVKLDF